MIAKLKIKFIFFVEILHRRIFGHDMSEEMREFLKNLSWSFFGGMIAAVIMFIINIVAARFLGPESFGNYNYLLSIASSSVFFFLLGNNQSSTRYISDKDHSKRRKSLMGALLFLTIFQTIIFFLVVTVLKGFIAGKLGINLGIIYLLFFWGVLFAFKELFDSFIRSFGLFKNQSIVRIGDAFFVLVTFISIFFIYKGEILYIHYIWAMISGAVFSIGAYTYLVRNKFEKFSKKDVKIIFNYNKFIIIGGLSGFIMGLEKVFIGKYIGIESLGIYSAYYASSHMIISNLGILFMNTFWPAIVKNKDNTKPVIEKINKMLFKYFPVWFFINIISVVFFMLLYGKQYPIHFSLVFLFSASSLLNIGFFIMMNFMNINRISQSTIINAGIYLILIASILIFRSIPVYLVVQIIIYLIGILYVKKTILRDASKIL